MATPLRAALAGAALVAVAASPSIGGLRASEAAADQSSVGVVGAGALQLRITALDGVRVAPTRTLDLHNVPVPSTFSIHHVVTVRNAGSAAIVRLALAVDAGRGDSDALSDKVSVEVDTCEHRQPRPLEAFSMPLKALEARTSPAPIVLPHPLGRGEDLDVDFTLSAAGLDNSLQGAQLEPRFTLIGGG